MNIGRVQKRILLFGILPAAALYLGLRVYAQFRHVDVYVGREEPMPSELASKLPMEELKIQSTVHIATQYEKGTNKFLGSEEI
jgi:hypothetical protein